MASRGRTLLVKIAFFSSPNFIDHHLKTGALSQSVYGIFAIFGKKNGEGPEKEVFFIMR